MSNKLNKIYLINYLQYAFLNDVEAKGAYFSRFHYDMTASTASASTSLALSASFTSLASVSSRKVGTRNLGF